MALNDTFFGALLADITLIGFLVSTPATFAVDLIQTARRRAHQRAMQGMFYQDSSAYGTDFGQNSNW